MKSAILLFLLCFVQVCHAQIPNPGFEVWSEGEPDGWDVPVFGLTLVDQEGDAHEGSSAARLITGTFETSIVGGTLSAAEFPQTTNEEALRGWYKAGFAGGDKIQIQVVIGTDEEAMRYGVSTINQSASVYTEFVVNLEEGAEGDPVKGMIFFILQGPDGGTNTLHDGTSFIVDDLSWGEPAPLSIQEHDTQTGVIESIFPCPANGSNGMIQYSLNRSGPVVLELFDLSGRKVMDIFNAQMAAGRYRVEFNSSGLSTGTYVCRLQSGGQYSYMRWVN